MGRKPADFEEECRQLKKGMWSAREDQVLKDYIKTHGAGKWRKSAKETGLQRCGKSLRLRWLNYLRPGITRGNISLDEEDLIIRMHKLVGNRWSLIAGRIPGRTDNEIKNYWNSTLSKKLAAEAEQKEKEQVVSKNKKPIVEDDGNQHLYTDEVLGGGLWTCFDSTDATAPSLGFGVGIDINNSTQPTGDYISCKAAMTRNDSLMDLNGGQLEISEFLQTDFSDFWDDSDRSFMNFEVGGCSTVNHEMPDLWHGYL